VLRDIFGYSGFRGDQEEIIGHLLGGGDAFVLMPTGGGKSLCYQIPAIIRSGTGVIVSPLIALMQDQVRAMHQLGVRAAFLNSTLSPVERSLVERQLSDGELDLLYVAPERLLADRTLAMLDRSRIALFAIDEAHCVSQWGHDFREEYLRLSVLHERYPDVPRIALTATADGPTRREIVERLNLGEARTFVSGFDRPNIRYHIVAKHNPKQQLLAFLNSEHPADSGIIYRLSRRKTEETAQWLTEHGRRALPYHAGMEARERQRNQEIFLHEENVLIVATIAFGMGIDKPDVRFVAHLDLPKSIEAYYQETGRAGRDGLPANAFMTYGLADVVMLRQLLDRSEADDQHKSVERRKLQALLGLCETIRCRRQVLLAYFGDRLMEPCGNCDTCLHPVEGWDGTEAAQKAMHCISQTGQRFGAVHLTDVLIGRSTERVKQFRHDKLSVFGSGSQIPLEEWPSIFRQLAAMGLLAVDMERYGAITLTSESRRLLQGEREVRFRRDPKPEKKRAKSRSTSGNASVAICGPEEAALFERLRELRLNIAREAGLPPYMIFHDSSLREMADLRPLTMTAFAGISGVGRQKLERYGERFIEVIRSDSKNVE